MKSETELLAIVEREEKQALGYLYGELNDERAKALDYYDQEPFGDEVEGRSQIVTSDVQDTVEWILPSLIKIFTSSDKAVEFEPEMPADEAGAKQATQGVNYCFYRQNNGFLVLYSWFKDALLQKNGYCKVWWDDSKKVRKEKYYGLTDMQFMMLGQQPEVEILAHTPNPDAHDVEIQITETTGRCRVEPVPPEEILVNREHRSVDLQDCRFVAHRCKKTASDLIEMGYDKKIIDKITSDDDQVENSPEWLARRRFDEEQQDDEDTNGDDATRTIWVTEAYILVDYDDDGIAERRKVIKAGKTVLENEECDYIPIISMAPIIRPHRHIGKSVAELAMDIQLIKSTLWRQSLDNLYLTNAPRSAVLSSASGTAQANLDDLLTVRPGGVVREYVPNAVRPLVVPYVGQHSMQMIEYLDQQRMNRTGVNNLSSGLDADAINKTARGAVLAENQMMQKVELIARVFAETGVKALFKCMLYYLSKYSMKPMMFRLRDEFVEYDPRQWNHMMDMTVNVGLGTGNKDQQLLHLNTIMQIQEKMVMMGGLNRTVTEKNVYQAAAKLVENAGFKSVEDFFTDPEKAPPQQPQPNPEEQKIQAEMQMKQQELQMKQVDGQNNIQLEQARLELEREKMALEAEKARTDMRIKLMVAQAEMALEREKAQNDIEIKRTVEMARLQQQAQTEQTKLQMEGEREGQKMVAEREDRQMAGGAAIQAIVEGLNKGFDSLGKTMARPRKIVRGPDGRAAGVE